MGGYYKMEHIGKSVHRLKSNPLEKIYAEEWAEENSKARGILDYLLAEDPNYPAGEVTERDAMVAATVIQWLGSPVGQGFVDKVMKRKKDENAY